MFGELRSELHNKHPKIQKIEPLIWSNDDEAIDRLEYARRKGYDVDLACAVGSELIKCLSFRREDGVWYPVLLEYIYDLAIALRKYDKELCEELLNDAWSVKPHTKYLNDIINNEYEVTDYIRRIDRLDENDWRFCRAKRWIYEGVRIQHTLEFYKDMIIKLPGRPEMLVELIENKILP